VMHVDCGDPASGLDCEDDQRGRIGATGQRAGDSITCGRKGAPAEEIGGVEQRRRLR
jgi:hypothetical protein